MQSDHSTTLKVSVLCQMHHSTTANSSVVHVGQNSCELVLEAGKQGTLQSDPMKSLLKAICFTIANNTHDKICTTFMVLQLAN